MRPHSSIATAFGLLAGLATALACRVPNEEHCANQDVAGNQFCRERSPGAPFCSPCERRLQGCVRFEPFACGGYDPDPGETPDATSGDDDGSSGGSSSSG
jgi:hypothetical protein